MLPSSPSIRDDLNGFVQSRINFFSEDSDHQPCSFTFYVSPESSSSSFSSDDDLEAIEVFNALSAFEGIGSSETQSGSFYDSVLSPVFEVDEQYRDILLSDSSLADEVFTDCSSLHEEGSDSQSVLSKSSESEDESRTSSLEETFHAIFTHDEYFIAFRRSSGSDTPDESNGYACPPTSPRREDMVRTPEKKLIVIKFIDKFLSQYERMKPYDCEQETQLRMELSRWIRRSVLLDVLPNLPEVDPILKEMIESFDVDDILKVLDEPATSDDSSLLNEPFDEHAPTKAAINSEEHAPNKALVTSDVGVYNNEEFVSPLVSHMDDMLENLAFDLELSLCPCTPHKCAII